MSQRCVKRSEIYNYSRPLSTGSSNDGEQMQVPSLQFEESAPPTHDQHRDKRLRSLNSYSSSSENVGEQCLKSPVRKSFSRPIVDKWKRFVKRALSTGDEWSDFHIEHYPSELAVRYRYNAIRQKWTEDRIQIKIEPESFARGAMRECFRAKKMSMFLPEEDWLHTQNYVVKRYITAAEEDTLFEDVRLQMDAKLWAEEYNRHHPPKQIDIFQISVLRFIERADQPLFHLEHFIEGKYVKHNSNSGYVNEKLRMTPQAFSHFSFERSGHQLIVVDIQGVGDLYTDPQIHTADGSGYGDGNLGTRGMALFFHSHLCNEICVEMRLSPFDLHDSEVDTLRCSKPTMGPRKSSKTILRSSVSECLPPIGSSPSASTVMAMLRTRTLSSNASDEIFDEEEENEFRRSTDSGFNSTTRDQMHGILAPLIESTIDENDASTTTTNTICDVPVQRPPTVSIAIRRSRIRLDSEPFGSSASSTKVHLDVARYHEIGRFREEAEDEELTMSSVDYDKAAAFYHLQFAARASILEAILTLGSIYLGREHELLSDVLLNDVADEDDDDEDAADQGHSCMTRAAELGDPSSMLYLAAGYELGEIGSSGPNYKWSVKWLEQALESDGGDEGYPEYQVHAKLAELYRKGGYGLEKNIETSAEYYNSAAESAMGAMKGKLANQYYMLAEEVYGDAEE